jgi:membrane-associated phospholipid phosphatase
LVALNYHFLSDTIGGGLLGASLGQICISAWQRW